MVKTIQRIDYEKIHSINFTLVAFDSGVPQLSTSAGVFVDVVNVNDEEPNFDHAVYEASVNEHSVVGTSVISVHATDDDQGKCSLIYDFYMIINFNFNFWLQTGEFGEIRYSLAGQSPYFDIDPNTGLIIVADNIDRESVNDVTLRAVATDMAPAHLSKSASVPVSIL